VPDADAAVAAVAGVLAPGDVVLVKASRAIALDSVANRLLHPEGERSRQGIG
jgi:UDP-N-acetylmuramoyl-tripeptide--D-alanyl-D-alanine ligase